MNYFGHAAVASWTTGEARDAGAELGGLALGAMLPDFSTMCGARLAREDAAGANAGDPIERGIALHHRTDAAFHRLPPVLALMRELDERLAHGGCARGPRRAVAHVGIELMLDGVLVDDDGYVAAYLAGIAHDASGVRWREAGDPEKFERLHARLRSYGAPVDLRSVAAIVQRLARVLAGRPLLAPSAVELGVIRDALQAQQARVRVAAETVMRGMRVAIVG